MPRQVLEQVYDIVDGCAVQYHCSTVLFSLALLAMHRGIRITRCVQATGHGKAEIDPLLGTEKTYADTRFDRPAILAEKEIEEVDIWAEMRECSEQQSDEMEEKNELETEIGENNRNLAVHDVAIHKMKGGQKLSLAKLVYEILRDPGRFFSD